MKYRILFENEDVKNLAHEVLSHHLNYDATSYPKFSDQPTLSYYTLNGRHDTEEKHSQLHHDLTSAGWTAHKPDSHAVQDDAGEDVHILSQAYTHPEAPRHSIMISHSRWAEGGDADSVAKYNVEPR